MCVLLSVVLFRLRLDHSVIYYILLNVLCFLSCYRHRFLKKIINDDEYPNVLQFIYRLGEALLRDNVWRITLAGFFIPYHLDLTVSIQTYYVRLNQQEMSGFYRFN